MASRAMWSLRPSCLSADAGLSRAHGFTSQLNVEHHSNVGECGLLAMMIGED
jgi:hypothetical protein